MTPTEDYRAFIKQLADTIQDEKYLRKIYSIMYNKVKEEQEAI